MLARERKRVVWSLAIGAFCASAIWGWEYREARIADSRLRALVEQCKADALKIHVPSGWVPNPNVRPPGVWKVGSTACEPDDIEADRRGKHFLVYSMPVQEQIEDLARHEKDRNVWLLPVAAFAVFCLPLIWYFLLDRIRELGAAISGRDLNP